MFQYAFGLAAAQRLGTRHAYNAWTLERYFTVESRWINVAKRCAVLGSNGLHGFDRREVVADDREDPDLVLESVTDRTRYGGHFYSERFFLPAASDVRTAFT